MLRITLASLHLLALALGLGAVFTRSAALRARPMTASDLRRVFRADGYWGAAAALWLGTGVWRLVAHTEKDVGYYFSNVAFMTKLASFLAIFALELYPIVTLVRWRRLARQGAEWRPDERTARRIATIGHVQAAIVIVMVVLATSMARGYGMR